MNNFTYYNLTICYIAARDSPVSTGTRSQLESPGKESRLGRNFLHPPRPVLWPPIQSPVEWLWCLLPFNPI